MSGVGPKLMTSGIVTYRAKNFGPHSHITGGNGELLLLSVWQTNHANEQIVGSKIVAGGRAGEVDRRRSMSAAQDEFDALIARSLASAPERPSARLDSQSESDGPSDEESAHGRRTRVIRASRSRVEHDSSDDDSDGESNAKALPPSVPRTEAEYVGKQTGVKGVIADARQPGLPRSVQSRRSSLLLHALANLSRAQ
ncbi:hypothetical protein MRB53_041771 [Persea americana]|nr:hypothetical protein MRB53_041771 [Persea americana]